MTTASPSSFTAVAYPRLLSLSVSHTLTTNFLGYQVRYRTTPGSSTWEQDWAVWPIRSATGTKTVGITGLTANTSYQVQMRALSRSGAPSDPVSMTVLMPASPSAPVGFTATTATSGAGAVDLAWTARTYNPGTEERYEVRSKLRSDSTWGAWTPIAASDYTTDSHKVTSLTAGSEYDFQVRYRWSVDVGSSSPSSTATATASVVPPPPNFEARPGSLMGTVNLSWNAVASATSYEYRCNPAGTGCSTTWVSTTATTATLSSLTGGDSYTFELRANEGSIMSAVATATSVAQTQPGPQTVAAADGTDLGEVRVTWTAPAGGITNVAEYQYRHKLSSAADSAFTSWTRVPDSDSDTQFNDEVALDLTGLLAATEYDIQLRVKTTASPATYSLGVEVQHETAPVPPPTALTADPGSNPGELDLAWNAPSPAIANLTYEFRTRQGEGAWSEWSDVGSVVDYTVTGLLGGAAHTVEVRSALANIGKSTSITAMGTPDALAMPTGVMASGGNLPGEIDLSWNVVPSAAAYEYRVKEATEQWPENGEWVEVSGGSTVSTIIDNLEPGTSHNIQLRATAPGIGNSPSASVTATSGDDLSDEVASDAPAVPMGYAISASTTTPGTIKVMIPANSDPFLYQTRTANPGEWSSWTVVRPAPTDVEYLITGLSPGVEYDVRLRVYVGGAMPAFSMILLQQDIEALEIKAPSDFVVSVSSGIIVLEWKNPNENLDVQNYEYRQRLTSASVWGMWMEVDHEGARDSTQQVFVTEVESGMSYQFELRIPWVQNDVTHYSSSATGSVISRVSLPELNSIKPVVREITVTAGSAIRLGVDIYNLQDKLDNDVFDNKNSDPTKPHNPLVFRWSEIGTSGGSFAMPGNERQVVYTAASSPGNYMVQAEAQPDGICSDHHEDPSTISAMHRLPCQATFTIRVTRAPGDAVRQPDPINPAGVIPSSMSDNEGIAYTVFTPVAGGTFIGEGFTVSAEPGAVPDRSLLAVNATVSAIPVPAPIPGASMSVAGQFYDVNGIAGDGQPPLPDYKLDDPIRVCLPFPSEFRADLSEVVMVESKSDGGLGILSTKVRTNAGVLTVCGAISRLPATLGVARLGTVPAPVATPEPEQELPETGGAVPGAGVLGLLGVLGLVLGLGLVVVWVRVAGMARRASMAGMARAGGRNVTARAR